MSLIEMNGYCDVRNANPERYDTYLVKTEEGTYEFAHYSLGGWCILGDNRWATVRLWRELPTTSL